MIICVPKLKGGKGFFYKRLCYHLRSMGIKVVRRVDDKFDVLLMARDFHLLRTLSRKKKIVLRLDGMEAILPHDKYLPIMKKVVSGIVYQSQFTKYIYDKYICKFKQTNSVIFNGADPDFFASVKPSEQRAKYQFLSFANWKPSQRLEDIVESYLLADVGDSCLVVAGNLRDSGVTEKKISFYRTDRRIHFLGSLPQPEMAGYLRSSYAGIHIRWCDWCPNGVVEAICAGLPVITNNVGGTRELVERSGGIICDIDHPLDSLPREDSQVPKINRGILSQAIADITRVRPVISCDHVNIRNVSKQYLSLFRKVLKS